MAIETKISETSKKIIIGGSGTLVTLFIILFSLSYYGVDVQTTGDIYCETECISYFNISLKDYSLCFDKTFYGINTEPEVNIEIYRADLRYKPDNPERWKIYNFTDRCLDKNKNHEFKIIGYKEPAQTIKWGLDVQGKNVDPYWYGNITYNIEGNKVYINDSKVYISAEPHTLRASGYVYFNLISKVYEGDVDVIFGFDTSAVKPIKIELYKPEWKNKTESYSCDFDKSYFEYTTSPKYAWCFVNITTYNNATGLPNGSYLNLIYEHSFEWWDKDTKTIYWNVPYLDEWKDYSSTFESINYDYGEMDKWYYAKNVPIEKNKEYIFKGYIDILPKTPKSKYWFAIKPSSETIQEAIDNDHFYALDPWTVNDCYAAGGVVSIDGDYCVHTFTSNLSFNTTISLNSSNNLAILVVAGGGGAGGVTSDASGGGGAGGVIYNTSYSIDANTNYNVIVGVGGNGGAASTNGKNGTYSVFDLINTTGGGGGGGGSNVGWSGGSGGGGGTSKNGGAGITGQGNAGGNAYGGGGGKGTAGVTSPFAAAKAGGDGWYYDINGTNICYGGGGGSGGGEANASCGGGNGQYPLSNTTVPCRNGINGTGGGGGGRWQTASVAGCSGGTGIVIVRYYLGAEDTEYPQFSNYWDNNNTIGIGLFNVTVINTNGTVLLEINNENITANNITSNVYNASYSFDSYGTYAYRWHSWGNGTNKNYNKSIERSYTPGSCNFMGIVKDENNNFVSGATVIIINQNTNNKVANLTTNNTGGWNYAIGSISNYTVIAYDPTNSSRDGDADPYIVCS